MGTAASDIQGNAAAKPLAATSDSTESDSLVKSPPKYPQVKRRPPNMPATTGGSSGGPSGPRPVATGGSSGGFFSINKKGQGYWTRMGTVSAAALIGALSIQFIFGERHTFNISDAAAEGICAVFAVGYGLLAFWLMNRPSHVDFLIATDSEMKKVNWTSREELMGSTKIVILFMFVIAIFLFITDLFFGYFFYWIGVLKEKPF